MKKHIFLVLLAGFGCTNIIQSTGILGGLFDKPRGVNPKAPLNPATGKPLSAYEIYGAFQRAFISAFSKDSFRTSALDPAELQGFNTLKDQFNDFAADRVGDANKAKLQGYIANLNTIGTFIQNTAQALHAGTVPATAFADAHRFAITAKLIENAAADMIKEKTTPSAAWLSGIPADNDKILNPSNKSLFNDYVTLAKEAERLKKAVTDVEITALLNRFDVKTNSQITGLMSNLEQYVYKTNDKNAKELLNDLYAQYPKLISPYFVNILSNTPNKPFTIVFAQAGAYENVLRQIIRELSR